MGKKAKPPRQLGEPHINGHKAVPYNTFHLNWQTRISKERNGAFPDDWEASMRNAPAPALETEFFPIGGVHSRNNGSRGFAMTFGGGSWHASGGLRSMHRDGFGCPNARDKAHLFRSGALRTSPASASRSLPDLHGHAPADASVKAEVMRPMMQRSVAGVLRHPEEYRIGTPTTPPPVILEDEARGFGGGRLPSGRAPGQASITAEVMRAMPYRSVASVLRHPGAVPEFHAPPPVVDGEQRGIMGKAEFRRPQDSSIKAEVVRGMMNQSVATVLRNGIVDMDAT